MDKAYNPQAVEAALYKLWEEGGYFTPKIDKKKKPFSILLPLPNANDPMHMGHAMFTIQDILIRYHRMKGDPTLWLPGGDHAGIETQFVFEKKLAKEGKSRFQFDRDTLYTMIAEFVDANRNINRDQMKRLGFSLDWTRYHYSLEPKIVETVLDTFRKMHEDGLAYRAERMVNYCTKCGTTFSDLEVIHEEKQDQLYFLNYGSIQIATARPETIFADVAVAVNPKDKRYTKLIGKTATIPIIHREIPIITDDSIQIDFGTGALKVTPAHAPEDYEIGKKHNLPIIKTIDQMGRMINVPQQYVGMKVAEARIKIVEDLTAAGALVKTEPLTHAVSICYRSKTTIEPMLMPQWYVKTKPLAAAALEAVKKGTTKIVPKKRFEKMYFDWMNNILDWNISRQIVWGPRIPVWYCLDCNPDISLHFITKEANHVSGAYQNLVTKFSFDEIKNGLQSLSAPLLATYALTPDPCKKCGGENILQETDTFDTWFLSSQWPLTTLGFPDSEDFKYFYPTSVLDTMWDILFFWVARMMMMGLYRTGKVPFEVVHLHSRVVDSKGQKMSKSKGNVINPLKMADLYGADALRFTMVFGAAPGSDIAVSEDKIRGMRNFANKLWNIGRFLLMNFENKTIPFYDKTMKLTDASDKKIVDGLETLITSVTKDIEKYRFSDAAQALYEFSWHKFADIYLEKNKERFQAGDEQALMVLRHVYLNILKLLHPFMPFVTEEIWSKMPRTTNKPLIIASWPKIN
jgi:valyl-tRNA synthetase